MANYIFDIMIVHVFSIFILIKMLNMEEIRSKYLGQMFQSGEWTQTSRNHTPVVLNVYSQEEFIPIY